MLRDFQRRAGKRGCGISLRGVFAAFGLVRLSLDSRRIEGRRRRLGCIRDLDFVRRLARSLERLCQYEPNKLPVVPNAIGFEGRGRGSAIRTFRGLDPLPTFSWVTISITPGTALASVTSIPRIEPRAIPLTSI